MPNEQNPKDKNFQKVVSRDLLAFTIFRKAEEASKSFPEEVQKDPIQKKLWCMMCAINLLIDFVSDLEFDSFGPCPGLEELCTQIKEERAKRETEAKGTEISPELPKKTPLDVN